MSSRRPADGPPAGQPDSQRQKTGEAAKPAFDIAAIRAQIAAKKAQVEADLAAKSKPSTPSTSTPPPSRPAGPSALPPPPTMDPTIAAKLQAAKARIEALKTRISNPYLSGSGSMPKAEPKPVVAPSSNVSSVALHPLLMGDSGGQGGQTEKNEKKAMRDRYKTMAPKFTSVRANQSAAPVVVQPVAAPVLNPYSGSAPAQEEKSKPNKARPSRKLQFAAQGKYVKQGDSLRNEAKMDALRARIAEASKKAGLDSEFEVLERSLKRQQPPEVEWWDKALVPEGNYADIDKAMKWIEESQDSLVTHLVQHPIQLPAPQDKKQPERGLMLTKKEQKKMRRQRRQAELEDKRDRQKMGLLPPDPPKVRLANLMKVLTSDAVQDPTKVEAKVRREVAHRANKHIQDNQDRKLAPELRKEKEYLNMVARERKGIYGTCYKIKYLTNGRHKYKVRETAKQDLLTGVCIFHPTFALVLVEGVDKGIKHYKQLLLNRIDWTEEARPLGEEEDKEDEQEATQAKPESMEDNRCELIWEGEVPERSFRQFRARHAESDTKGKEWLTPKYEGMWDLAKKWQWEGEDL